MARQITIPLEWANNIPGVSGVDDVDLELAEEETIIDDIVDRVGSQEDTDQTVREAVQDSLADGVLDDRDGTLDLDIPGADAVADAVLDRLDVEPGLFGPLEEPLDVVLQEAVRDGLEDLGDLDVGLPDLDGEDLVDLPDVVDDLIDDVQDLIDDVGDLADQIDELAENGLGDVGQTLEDRLLAVGPEVDGAGLFTEPVAFVEAVVREAIDRQVSEEARQELEAVLDED
jgi:hypothetical protein